MLSELSVPARRLADYMSELSEEAYCAGWMMELEYDLWNALIEGPREYGFIQLTNEHIAQLRKLSRNARGWIVFDPDTAETLLRLAEWKKKFSAWRQRKATTSDRIGGH